MEEKEELDVYEARQINKQYSDNWDLVGYTAELRNNSDDSLFAFVNFNAEGEGRIRECPHCLKYDLHYRLGHKIKKKNEPPAPDDDQFSSCYQCGRTFGIHETFQEAKIKDTLQTTDNPFESNESIFVSTESRASQRRKGKIPKSKRFNNKENNPDPDIQAEIDKGNIVRAVENSFD